MLKAADRSHERQETDVESQFVMIKPDNTTAVAAKMRRREATIGGKASQRWFLALCDLFSESLSPMLVLYPVMFMHVGVARGTFLMLGSTML